MTHRLRLKPGDRVRAIATDGGIFLAPCAEDTQRALEIAARAAKKCRHALRELAK